MLEPTANAYAHALPTPRPRFSPFWKASLALTLIAAAGGIGITLRFLWTDDRGLIDAGLAWLSIGGGIMIVAVCCGIVCLREAEAAASPAGHRRAAAAVLLRRRVLRLR